MVAALKVPVVLAALISTCAARALPQTSSYGSSVYHVQSSVPSSHQSVTLSDLHTADSSYHDIPHAIERHSHEHDHPLPYKFEYKVHDSKNHNYHERAESSDGQVVRGFYSLLEPHGEVRVVKYRADHGGFQSEVSRHGSRHGDSNGGGLGATIGGGPAHDLGSHGLGVSASSSMPSPVIHHHVSPSTSPKHSIPIHEEHSEESNQWSAIEDPKKSQGLLKGQALEEIPAPSKEALGQPGGHRIPEQILLQQKKKKVSLIHGKPVGKPNHLKFLKRPPPSLHLGPRPGGPGGHRPLGPFPPYFHRGAKRGPAPSPQLGPRPRSSGPPSPGPGSAPLPQRREARPPPTPCKCSDHPPGHAAGHLPAQHGRKLT